MLEAVSERSGQNVLELTWRILDSLCPHVRERLREFAPSVSEDGATVPIYYESRLARIVDEHRNVHELRERAVAAGYAEAMANKGASQRVADRLIQLIGNTA